MSPSNKEKSLTLDKNRTTPKSEAEFQFAQATRDAEHKS